MSLACAGSRVSSRYASRVRSVSRSTGRPPAGFPLIVELAGAFRAGKSIGSAGSSHHRYRVGLVAEISRNRGIISFEESMDALNDKNGRVDAVSGLNEPKRLMADALVVLLFPLRVIDGNAD